MSLNLFWRLLVYIYIDSTIMLGILYYLDYYYCTIVHMTTDKVCIVHWSNFSYLNNFVLRVPYFVWISEIGYITEPLSAIKAWHYMKYCSFSCRFER